MDEYLRKYGSRALLISLALIIFSIVLIFNPIKFLNTLMIIFGIIVVVDGLIHLMGYLKNKDNVKEFNFELALGVIEIIAGIAFILNPSWLISILPIIIGIWIIIESLTKLKLSFEIKANQDKHWITLLVFSLITILLGIYIIFHPITTSAIIITISGIILLISECINALECVYIMVKIK